MANTHTTLKPQVIVVSGGSRGLGAAICQRLLTEGHLVATFSRTATDFVHELQADRDLADRFHFEAIDIRDEEALHTFVVDVHTRYGRIDALVNNAGIARDGVLALANSQDITQMLEINLKSALVLAKECSRWMLLQRSGCIINISSIIGQRGFSGLSAYAATKAGLDGMTRALARELGPRNIRVNSLAPGYLETEMSHGLDQKQREQIIRRTPLGRLGRTDDVVGWVRFLLTEESHFVTGQVITIDGGASV